jgi:hypothetical protein
MRSSIPHLLALFSLAVYALSPVATALPAFPSVDFILAVIAAAAALSFGVRRLVRAYHRAESGAVWSSAAVVAAAVALGLWGNFVITVYRSLGTAAG